MIKEAPNIATIARTALPYFKVDFDPVNKEYKAKVPPSPSLSARRMKTTYLKVTSHSKHQTAKLEQAIMSSLLAGGF